MNVVREITDLPSGWKEKVVELMRQGKSVQYVLAEFNITKTRHYRFIKESDEYREVFEIATGKLWQFWEDEGGRALTNRNYNSPIFNKLTGVILRWNDNDHSEDNDHHKKKAENQFILDLIKELRKPGLPQTTISADKIKTPIIEAENV